MLYAIIHFADNESFEHQQAPENQINSIDRDCDVKLCAPTMGKKRICGSGGWFGWYGWFSEKDFGKYFAYYGKASGLLPP